MITFRRLLGFLRPYRRTVIASLVFAWLAMVMTVLIPWLVGQAVNAIENHDKAAILPLVLAIAGAGLLRLGLTVIRRLIAGKVSVNVEYDLRERMYEHLQSLELGFFDSQQTGQLMSRATVDLQSIRFFLGYGLIFLTQNALTLALASIVMFTIKPDLAALALAPVPFVVLSAMRYNRRSRPAVQEIQQRLAELTAEVEESISGIRIVKAFARERHMLGRFRRSVLRVFDQNIYSTRLQAFYSPLLGFLPSLGLAVVLLIGGREVINGGLSLGDFAAFYTYLIMLTAPMRMLGMSLGMAQRAVASGNRVFEILDREPRIESPPDAPSLPEGPGARGAARRLARLQRRGARARGRGAEGRRGTNGCAGRSVGVGEDEPGRAPRAALRPESGFGARGRRRPAERERELAALADRVRRRRQLPVLSAAWPRTSPTRTRMRRSRRSRPPRGGRRRTGSSRASRTVTPRWSASGG